jgi:hypothetical protein
VLRDVWGTKRARRGGVARSDALGRMALPWASSGGARRARPGSSAARTGRCWCVVRSCEGAERQGREGGAWHGCARRCQLGRPRDIATCARPWLSPACTRRLRPPFCLPRRAVRSQRREECRGGLNSTNKPHIPRIDPRVARIGEEQVGDHRVFDDLLEPKQRAMYYLIFPISLYSFGSKFKI